MTDKNDNLIVADPEICHGKPTIKGTRVMVWQILEILEAGGTAEEIYKSYPSLPQGSVEAALHYAAENAKGIKFITFDKKIYDQAKIPA